MRVFVAMLLCTSAAIAHAGAERRGALLVGHPFGGAGLTPLRYVGHDLERMREVLTLLGGFAPDAIEVSLGEDAETVAGRFARIGERLGAEPGAPSVFLFYYSGHAQAGELRLGDSRLSFARVKELIEGTGASVRLAVLDSCRAGEITELKGARKVAPIAVEIGARQSGLVLITASGADEDAQESDAIQGSYFTHFLASGMRGAADKNGDGQVTLGEAYGFAYENTLTTTVATRGGIQHPTYRYDLRGAGDLVLTRLDQRNGIIAWPAEVHGHFILFSRSRNAVVAEFDKQPGQPAELGVAPGGYVVKLRASDHLKLQRVEVADRGRVLVEPARMERVAFADDYAKGAVVTVDEVVYGRTGVSLALALVGQTFLSAPAREDYFASLAIARLQLDLDDLIRRRVGLFVDLGLGGSGVRSLTIGDDRIGRSRYRVRLTEVEAGLGLTYRYPATRALELGGLARLGVIVVGREFVDAALPAQSFATMSPGLGLSLRWRLAAWLRAGAEVRVHYMFFHVDQPMSLAYVDGGLNLAVVLR